MTQSGTSQSRGHTLMLQYLTLIVMLTNVLVVNLIWSVRCSILPRGTAMTTSQSLWMREEQRALEM